jgi:hypothetical protein
MQFVTLHQIQIEVDSEGGTLTRDYDIVGFTSEQAINTALREMFSTEPRRANWPEVTFTIRVNRVGPRNLILAN